MAKVLVIGATGETGSRLVRALVECGHHPVALYRRDEQEQELIAAGAIPFKGDLLSADVSFLEQAVSGVDAVVFTAGSNGGGDDQTDQIDLMAVVHSANAALSAGVQRYLLVSAFPDAWRDRDMPPDFEHYMFVKRQADVHLSHTNLDWVIVRPGTLTNTPGTGAVRAGLAIPYGDVSRDNLARMLVSLIEAPNVKRVIIELTDGDTAIPQAVSGFA